MLLRGLAHPIIFNGGFGGGEEQQEEGERKQPSSSGSSSSSRGGGRGRGDGAAFGSFLQTFGAVPVSGRNLHSLLAQGEAVLLYPGGVREVRRPLGRACAPPARPHPSTCPRLGLLLPRRPARASACCTPQQPPCPLAHTRPPTCPHHSHRPGVQEPRGGVPAAVARQGRVRARPAFLCAPAFPCAARCAWQGPSAAASGILQPGSGRG
jgi:hypothetical protein